MRSSQIRFSLHQWPAFQSSSFHISLSSCGGLFKEYDVIHCEEIYKYRITKAYKQCISDRACQPERKFAALQNAKLRNPKVRTCRTTFGRHVLGNRLPRLLNSLYQFSFQLESNTFKTVLSFLASKHLVT